MQQRRLNMILIIDNGLGNIGSVVRMIERLGYIPTICSSPEKITSPEKIILPGVGNFDHGIIALRQRGFDASFWNTVVRKGIDILGICLGMQLLCRYSEEGIETGLNLFDGSVKKFHFPSDQNLKVPHMGWNIACPTRPNPLIPINDDERRYYFVHSYYVVPDNPDLIIASANYGGDFCAAFQKDNIFGVQFHPEKSHRFGMDLIKRFIEL